MTRHHGYVPWPSSTGALAPCRFCDMPAKHLIHATPVRGSQMMTCPACNGVDSMQCPACLGLGYESPVKDAPAPITAAALATERERWLSQTDELYESIRRLKAERDAEKRNAEMQHNKLDTMRKISDAHLARAQAAEAELVEIAPSNTRRCPVDCQYRCHHTTQQEVFAAELHMAWDLIRVARAERDQARAELAESWGRVKGP